ncbi:hypothetical protein PsYK624_135910 [Phanerochaete sordida]|uniref:DUF6535 domain-containing protein n=1 Tax=Phanerochaete sordida TaxID=48140 RepID=A0A9P3LJH0_9APHY|nr:hypothetical protein PsYK624_135910 [Phanerochaete sordida]
MSSAASSNLPGRVTTSLQMPGNFGEPESHAADKEPQEHSEPGVAPAVSSRSSSSTGEKSTAVPGSEGFHVNDKPATQKLSDERQGGTAPEVKKGWPFLLDSAQKHDSAKIERWKAELDNLLVFAGLFSGVLTAYTIESYSWLREDPTATTNRILLLMSAQLASFSTSPGFVNSTAPSAAQVVNSFVFQPDRNDVVINTLWFISLVFSLLASFFAIAAQQWIRALPLPEHLPIMHSIRLWERRHEQLIAWQLPNVIMILPVFLQIAVVMFIVGLYYLLRSLSHPVTAAFAAVSIIPFGFYAISLPAPFLWPSSPYKSPIIPLLFLISQWAALLCVFLVRNLIVRPLMFVQRITGKFHKPMSHSIATHIIHAAWIDRALTWMTESLQKLTFSTFLTHHDIYFTRETTQLAVTRKDDRNKNILKERGRALGRAPVVVSRSELSLLSSCFSAFPCHVRVSVMVQWLAMYFGTSEVNLRLTDRRSPVDRSLLARITVSFARDYTSFLLDALPHEGELPRNFEMRHAGRHSHRRHGHRDSVPFPRAPSFAADWLHQVEDIACILIFLTGMYMEKFTDDWAGARDRNEKTAWIFCLMQACGSQVLSQSPPQAPPHREGSAPLAAPKKIPVTSARYRFPTVCLYGSIAADSDFKFTSEEINELCSLANKCVEHAKLVFDGGHSGEIVQVVDMVFGSVASVLLAFTRETVSSASDNTGPSTKGVEASSTTETPTSVSALLRAFSTFIAKDEGPEGPQPLPQRHSSQPKRLQGIQAAAELARQHDFDHRLVIVRRATTDIVNSLFILRKRNDISHDVVDRAAFSLSSVCKGQRAFDLPATKLPTVSDLADAQKDGQKDDSQMSDASFNSLDFLERLRFVRDMAKAPTLPSHFKSPSFTLEQPSLEKDAPPQNPDDPWRSD